MRSTSTSGSSQRLSRPRRQRALVSLALLLQILALAVTGPRGIVAAPCDPPPPEPPLVSPPTQPLPPTRPEIGPDPGVYDAPPVRDLPNTGGGYGGDPTYSGGFITARGR